MDDFVSIPEVDSSSAILLDGLNSTVTGIPNFQILVFIQNSSNPTSNIVLPKSSIPTAFTNTSSAPVNGYCMFSPPCYTDTTFIPHSTSYGNFTPLNSLGHNQPLIMPPHPPYTYSSTTQLYQTSVKYLLHLTVTLTDLEWGSTLILNLSFPNSLGMTLRVG